MIGEIPDYQFRIMTTDKIKCCHLGMYLQGSYEDSRAIPKFIINRTITEDGSMVFSSGITEHWN